MPRGGAAAASAAASGPASAHTHSSCSETAVGYEVTQLRLAFGGGAPAGCCGMSVQAPLPLNCQPVGLHSIRQQTDNTEEQQHTELWLPIGLIQTAGFA